MKLLTRLEKPGVNRTSLSEARWNPWTTDQNRCRGSSLRGNRSRGSGNFAVARSLTPGYSYVAACAAGDNANGLEFGNIEAPCPQSAPSPIGPPTGPPIGPPNRPSACRQEKRRFYAGRKSLANCRSALRADSDALRYQLGELSDFIFFVLLNNRFDGDGNDDFLIKHREPLANASSTKSDALTLAGNR